MIKEAAKHLVETRKYRNRWRNEFSIYDAIKALDVVVKRHKVKHNQYINEYYFNNDEK